MKIVEVDFERAAVALMGHIGVGHAVSHSGFMQDDSYGFAMLLHLLMQAHPLDLTITECNIGSLEIELRLKCGGIGKAYAARGISAAEKILLQKAKGMKSFSPQYLAVLVMGRMYGQGVTEVCSAFTLAYAKAVLDAVRLHFKISRRMEDNTVNSCGEFLAGKIMLDDIPVAWMLSINASPGGIGPNEDSEGNIPIGNKGRLMREFGMLDIPTVILESKAFVPALEEQVKETGYWVRWNDDVDNRTVGRALIAALEKLGYSYWVNDKAYPRNDGSLEAEIRRIGTLVEEIGCRYKNSSTAAERVQLAHDLVKLVSEDLGGSIFMSDKIFREFAGGGLAPGRGAVLSMVIPFKILIRDKQVLFADLDMEQSLLVLCFACRNIMDNYEMALSEITEKKKEYDSDELLRWASLTN